jgi:hypothetical protein
MHMSGALSQARTLGPISAGISEIGQSGWRVWVLGASILVCFLLQLHIVVVQPVNWDEFRYLADIYAYQRGELSSRLLTFQVHVFGWLTGLGDEMQQIVVARLVMLLFETGTALSMWLIARNFFDRATSLFAPLAFLSFSFVLQHGASFRFDPMMTFLVMSCVYLVLTTRLRAPALIGIGLTLALAAMVTVKVALAVPLLLGVGAYRIAVAERRIETLGRLTAAAAAGVAFLGLLYLWHSNTLASAAPGMAQEQLSASYAKTVGEWRLLPSYRYFIRAAYENLLHWILLGTGIVITVRRRGTDRAQRLLFLAFLFPLLSIAVYRNAFPYFYAFALAPASVLFAAAAEAKAVARLSWLVAAFWVASAVVHHQRALTSDAAEQRQVIKEVHALFPEPVPYIDRCSMISSFPQAGIFLSSWWLENYVAAGRPVMNDLLAKTQPAFILVNSPVLTQALGVEPSAQLKWSLLPEDRTTLQSNYVHYRGALWVAGKRFDLSAQWRPENFPISGNYLVQSTRRIRIDGQMVRPGQAVSLARGRHLISSPDGPQRAVLRWGAHLPPGGATVPREIEFGRF